MHMHIKKHVNFLFLQLSLAVSLWSHYNDAIETIASLNINIELLKTEKEKPD